MVAHGHDTWITRRPDATGVAGNLYSRAGGSNSMADLTVRMPMAAGGVRLEPYASVTWQQFDRSAMNEGMASPAALQVARLSATGTRAELGINLGSMQQNPLVSEVTFRVGAAVGEDSRGLLSPAVQATLGGESFTTQAPGIGRGFVQLQANGTLRLSRAAYLYGGLTDELGARRSSYGVTAGVRVSF
jgi:outer membrane autotransporter protein